MVPTLWWSPHSRRGWMWRAPWRPLGRGCCWISSTTPPTPSPTGGAQASHPRSLGGTPRRPAAAAASASLSDPRSLGAVAAAAAAPAPGGTAHAHPGRGSASVISASPHIQLLSAAGHTLRARSALLASCAQRLAGAERSHNPAAGCTPCHAGAEIWRQTGGRVTHVIAGMGTSGTIMGIR